MSLSSGDVLCFLLTRYFVACCYSATFSTHSHWLIFNWRQIVYKPWALLHQHQFFSERIPLYRPTCIDASNAQQYLQPGGKWHRHSRTHSRFTRRRCEPIRATHAELQQHLATHIATTSTQTGPTGASPATGCWCPPNTWPRDQLPTKPTRQ